MIVYSLKCANQHKFDSWFRDSLSYEKQIKSGLVVCPHCGIPDVEKAMMAPNIARSNEQPISVKKDNLMDRVPAELLARQVLREMHQQVEAKCDDVGKNFIEEVRKIHNGEAEERNICGIATIEETKELLDEGIEFGVLPDVPPMDA